MTEPAISIRGIGKQYKLGGQRERYARLTDSLAGVLRRTRQATAVSDTEFWALRDITFDVAHGDVVGIIGRNGAGKSTLLKVLSRITEPTEGEAIFRGRLASLLEVGTGFHPELTGRENIFMSGSVLGMRRAEINRRFDEIVDFAEVERFLDTPVKRYSSGMQVRLGFAVAAHLDPEILVVDEVLAVGDAAFQRKCLSKMEDVSHGGRTVLFVSHNMASVEHLCNRGVLLDHGQISAIGEVRSVVQAYLTAADANDHVDLAQRKDREGDGRIKFTAIGFDLRTGSDGSIRLGFIAEPEVRNIEISLGVFTLRGEGVVYLGNALTGDPFRSVPTRGTIVCQLPHSGILPGRYTVNVYCTANGIVSDWIVGAADFDVAEGDYYLTGKTPLPGYGSVAVPHRWSIETDPF